MPSTHTPTTKTALYNGASELDLSHAADALRSGHLVAFPTETVYGLGADATNASAVSHIFRAKNRPQDNPLIVHLSSQADLHAHALTPLPLAPPAARLAKAFWPGPLTLILPLAARASLAPAVTAGLRSVALRVPRHPVASALLARAAVPVAAPSANLSGRPSPTCAAHVLRDLQGAVHGVVDAGELSHAAVGLESTVVDLTDPDHPAVLRPGAVSAAQLEAVVGLPFRKAAATEGLHRPKAPGMKYRHYAPAARVCLVDEFTLEKFVGEWRKQGIVGVLADEEVCRPWLGVQGVRVVPCGSGRQTEAFARELYGALRAFDGEGVQAVCEQVVVILAVPPKDVDEGIGEAVLNRLNKAAAGGDLREAG